VGLRLDRLGFRVHAAVRVGVLTDYQRAEQLLRQGYAVQGVRDRDAIADWLRLAPRQTRTPRTQLTVGTAPPSAGDERS